MTRPSAIVGFTIAGLLFALASCSDSSDINPKGETPTRPELSPPSPPPITASPGRGSRRSETASEGGAGGAPDERTPSPPGGEGGEGGDGAQPPNHRTYSPDDGVLHVWTLGDSITLGPQGGYRNDIYRLLTEDGFTVDMVGTLWDESTEIADKDHEGHVAWTIQKTLNDVAGWLDQIPTPDIAFLWLGANDLAWWTNMTPAEHVSDLVTLIDHVLTLLPEQSKVVVATLAPQSSTIVESVGLDRMQMAEDFNHVLRQKVPQHSAFGKRLFLADVRKTLSHEDLYDGIHPTREAHARVAGVFYEVLVKEAGL